MSRHEEDEDATSAAPSPRYSTTRRTTLQRGYAASDGRSVADLLRELSSETVHLVRQELELAKAEMREKFHVYQRSMMTMGAGAVLLLAALLTGLWAVNTGLTALLAQSMDLGIAVWLSPLILTVVLGAMGWGMIGGAKKRMKEEGLVPQQTTTALRDDKRWAKRKAHEIKEDITHGR